MIKRASFTHFKSLRRVDAGLGRFTVIVGPNGSGKTSLLDGLDYLARVTQWPLAAILTGPFSPSSLRSRGAAGPMKLELAGHFQGVEAEVEAEIDDQAGASSWTATVRRRWGETTEQTAENQNGVQPAKPGATKGPPRPIPQSAAPIPPSPFARRPRVLGVSPNMKRLADELGSARKLRLDVDQLAAPSYSREERPRLDVDGKGLASVLADLAGRSPDTFQAITEAARRIVPALERIRTRRAQVVEREAQVISVDDKPIAHPVDRNYWGQQIVLDYKGASDVLAPLASEGTLLVIGLLTAVFTEPRPRVLLLDDIDKALHPRAQGELVAQLRSLLEMDPALQIVATSHSPYLLDHFDAADVLVTALTPDGSTACAPLSAHADYDRWKTTTQSGELWSFLGEDWVAKQAPRRAGGHPRTRKAKRV